MAAGVSVLRPREPSESASASMACLTVTGKRYTPVTFSVAPRAVRGLGCLVVGMVPESY
jgi:hypothetical protein